MRAPGRPGSASPRHEGPGRPPRRGRSRASCPPPTAWCSTGFKHVLGKDGKLNKKILINGKSTSLTVRAVIPELVQHDVVGVLKVFRQRLSTFLDSKDGKLALLDTGEIDKMVTEVYKKYSILLEISYT